MNFKSSFVSMLSSLLAFALALLALVIVVFPAGIVIESVFPGSLGPNNMPTTIPSQLLLITISFIGGTLGTLVVTLIAQSTYRLHAILFGALVLAINILIITSSSLTVPVWISVMLIILVAPQVLLGFRIGIYIRNPKKNSGSSPPE